MQSPPLFWSMHAWSMHGWEGAYMGWRTKEGKKKRHLLSRLSAREVAGKLSGPANDIPFLQQLDAVLQLLKLFSHIPTSRKTSTGASHTPRSQPQDLFFARVSPSSPSSSLSPFSPFPFCAPRPSDHRSLRLLKYPGDKPTYR